MPVQKDLKRQVRARMRKTGESYTAARAQLVRKPRDTSSYPELAGMSDAAVSAKTGRSWVGWVRALDRIGASSMSHRDIAQRLRDDFEVSPWWAQTVCVGYERIRGLRDKGQRRGGGFEVNKSKTYPVALAELYRAFGARERVHWLGDTPLKIRKATRHKSMRITWGDGTPVDVYFWDKTPTAQAGQSSRGGKAQVQLQHRDLKSKAEAQRVREAWTERLAALGQYLRDR